MHTIVIMSYVLFTMMTYKSGAQKRKRKNMHFLTFEKLFQIKQYDMKVSINSLVLKGHIIFFLYFEYVQHISNI